MGPAPVLHDYCPPLLALLGAPGASICISNTNWGDGSRQMHVGSANFWPAVGRARLGVTYARR